MSNEQEQVKLSRETAGQPSEISEARRRWVKGSFWAVPVLLTLPKISSAVVSNQHCATQATPSAVNPSGYLVVSRPTYVLSGTGPGNGATVVYGGPVPVTSTAPSGAQWCSGFDWHDVANWNGTTYSAVTCTGNTVNTFTDGTNTYTATSPGTANVLVYAGTLGDGTSVGIGPANGAYVFPDANGATGSCWTSAMPGITPPA